MKLILPYPPSVNHYWRSVPGKGTIISAEGRAYAANAAKSILIQGGERFGAESIGLVIDVFLPDKRRRDLDNLLKVPLDVLCKAGVYDDDSQVQSIHICKRGVDKARPRLEVWVSKLNA